MKDVLKAVLIFVVIIIVLCSIIKSSNQDRQIEMKKIEWDMKIEENRRKFGK